MYPIYPWCYEPIIYKYRFDPVPYIHKKKYHRGCVYRHPRTTQEKRWNIAHKDYVRGKRHASNLPDVWDDFCRSDLKTNKSWKKTKKRRQWMQNK